MRFIPFKLEEYDFLFYKNSIFCALKYLLNKTGDDALKIEFRLQFFCLSKYVDICRIRGPPSFNLKEILD